MVAVTQSITFNGALLQRGFWLYVWEVTPPSGKDLLYVGRTGDNSSMNAQSPFNRMSQHLGFAPNSSMLRRHLCKREVDPEQCRYRLIAHGPVLLEVDDRTEHYRRRDFIAAIERALADDLAAAGYEVMNKVTNRPHLDRATYYGIKAAFAKEFPTLAVPTAP